MEDTKEKKVSEEAKLPKEKLELKSLEQNEDPNIFIKDGKKYQFNTEGVYLPTTRLRDEKGNQGAYKFGKYAGKQVTKEEVLKNPELLDLILSNKLAFIREIVNEKGGK